MRNGTQAVPYNYFTNYDAIICKREKIILVDLFFAFCFTGTCFVHYTDSSFPDIALLWADLTYNRVYDKIKVYLLFGGRKMNFAILLAGGVGARMGQPTPKQYLIIENKPVLIYTLETFEHCDNIDRIVIVADPVWHGQIRQWLSQYHISKFLDFADPGITRQDSVYSGLCRCISHSESEQDIVLVHEAARALISNDLICRIIAGLDGYQACIPVMPMKDSILLSYNGNTIDDLLERSTLFCGQAPESFHLRPYYALNKQTPPEELASYRADHELCFHNHWRVHCIPGEESAFKLTTPGDIEQMIAYLKHTQP